EDAYAVVQSSAMKTWHEQRPLKDTLWENEQLQTIMSQADLDELFSGAKSLSNVDYIFERCGL
ncbi:MAG: adenylosuccinate lyase, partial [Candidatus Kapabacteria bacterium]|nr:adenylosuccinate lyase [Candidatus Kapabacteria bacterium]